METAMIKIDGVDFSYGKMHVIRGISLDIGRGEILGILGPNGAGKSTLLQLLGGVLTPASGSISIDGRPVARMSARDMARRIAHVSQSPMAPLGFTCLEIVLMGRTPYLSPFGFESKDDVVKALSAMEETDCVRFASRRVDELSGGERQRVFLARAIAQDTEVLILDEPTTFLDIKHMGALRDALTQLNRKREATIVLALHDINLAAGMCGRICLMKDGAIEADGAPSDVISEANIGRIFEANARVRMDESTGVPYCVV